MSVEDIIKRFDRGLCRCCHAEGMFHDLDQPRFILDQREVYTEMLKTSFDIDVAPISGPYCKLTYTICDGCIVRLRDATNFKNQVLLCERKLKEIYDQVLQDSSSIQERSNDGQETLHYTILKDALEIGSSTNAASIEVKLEDLGGAIAIKQEPMDAETEEDDDGDGLDSRFDDEATPAAGVDTKQLIKIKQEKEEKRKSAAKAKSSKKSSDSTDPKPTSAKKSKKGADGGNETEAKKPKGPVMVKPKFFLKEEDYRQEGDGYMCARCDKKYDKIFSLRFHVKTKHYNIPRFICTYCKKGFMTPAPLAIHKLQEHNIDERFNCNACNAVFNTKIQLRKHINNFHMLGEKYKCESCEYESFSFESMYKHKFKHRTVKDFHCRFCRKSFLRKATLDLHERIHTGDRRKVCKVCGQAFVQKASLNYHMTKYHPEVNF